MEAFKSHVEAAVKRHVNKRKIMLAGYAGPASSSAAEIDIEGLDKSLAAAVALVIVSAVLSFFSWVASLATIRQDICGKFQEIANQYLGGHKWLFYILTVIGLPINTPVAVIYVSGMFIIHLMHAITCKRYAGLALFGSAVMTLVAAVCSIGYYLHGVEEQEDASLETGKNMFWPSIVIAGMLLLAAIYWRFLKKYPKMSEFTEPP